MTSFASPDAVQVFRLFFASDDSSTRLVDCSGLRTSVS